MCFSDSFPLFIFLHKRKRLAIPELTTFLKSTGFAQICAMYRVLCSCTCLTWKERHRQKSGWLSQRDVNDLIIIDPAVCPWVCGLSDHRRGLPRPQHLTSPALLWQWQPCHRNCHHCRRGLCRRSRDVKREASQCSHTATAPPGDAAWASWSPKARAPDSFLFFSLLPSFLFLSQVLCGI